MPAGGHRRGLRSRGNIRFCRNGRWRDGRSYRFLSQEDRKGQMGLLDRMRGRHGSSVPVRAKPAAATVSLLGGQDDLEVVGELAYQVGLWRLCGRTLGDRVRCDIVAVLV